MIQRVIDLDFALERRITVTLREITWAEFLYLRVLSEERHRWEEEEIQRKAKQQRG